MPDWSCSRPADPLTISVMAREQPDTPIQIDTWRSRRRKDAGLFTIKDVGDACGLPQPVVSQLVPRTWTEAGWMYTAEQLGYALQIAPQLREGRYVPPQSEHDEPR